MTRLRDESRPARTAYTAGDEQLDRQIADLLDQLKPYPHRDLLREIMVTAVKLARQNATRGDLKILRTAMKEVRYAYKIFDRYRGIPKVTIFGSARTVPGDPDFETAREVARRLAQSGYMVITGAGSGIMSAGNLGAGRKMSFGLNILLPFEQIANETIHLDTKLINFRYFFTRKLFFIKESEAIILLPGGFGTQDEGFEALTLVQTGKDEPTPIVMLDRPGGQYWNAWRDFVKNNLLSRGLVSPEDGALFKITDSVEEACAEIDRFYRRYHSCRYVDRKQKLVLRLREPIGEELIGSLNDQFRDILIDGEISSCDPFPEEQDEPELLPLFRLVFPFDQRHFARLRQLIDVINR